MGTATITEKDIFRSLIAPESLTTEIETEIFNNMRLFFSKVTKNIFKNEYYALYEALKAARKYKAILNFNHFNQIVLNNIEKLINSENVVIEEFATDMMNMDLVKEEFIKLCCDTYLELSNMPLDSKRFQFNLALYIEAWAEEELKKCMVESYQILTEGKKIRGKFLQGTKDADEYYRRETAYIYDMLDNDENKLSSILVAPDGYNESRERMQVTSKKSAVTYTGIESVDEDLGMFYKGDLIVIQGPPAGGKTRFAINLCYNALKNGENGLYFALEDDPNRYLSMFLARHLIEKFDCEIDADSIFKASYDPQLKPVVDEAWFDLFHNENLGRFEIIPPPLFDEEIEEVLEEKWDNLFPFSWVVFDYTSLIDSRTKRNATEILSALMPKLETLTKSFKGEGFLLILPHQLTADSIEDLINGKDTTIIGSADSKAVMKSAQIAFTIYTDSELKARSKSKLICTKARHRGGFPVRDIYSNLGVCFYQDLPDDTY